MPGANSSRLLQFGGEREQRDILRALDRYREPALMARASARHAARKNFAALLDERRQNLGLLVVDEIDAIDAKTANFLFANEVALSSFRRSAGAAAATLRTRARWSSQVRDPGPDGGACCGTCPSDIRFLPIRSNCYVN